MVVYRRSEREFHPVFTRTIDRFPRRLWGLPADSLPVSRRGEPEIIGAGFLCPRQGGRQDREGASLFCETISYSSSLRLGDRQLDFSGPGISITA